MKKKVLVYMETDSDWDNKFMEEDILQELSWCTCSYDNVIIKIWNMEDNKNEIKSE